MRRLRSLTRTSEALVNSGRSDLPESKTTGRALPSIRARPRPGEEDDAPGEGRILASMLSELRGPRQGEWYEVRSRFCEVGFSHRLDQLEETILNRVAGT